jgi:hypothetical protein
MPIDSQIAPMITGVPWVDRQAARRWSQISDVVDQIRSLDFYSPGGVSLAAMASTHVWSFSTFASAKAAMAARTSAVTLFAVPF